MAGKPKNEVDTAGGVLGTIAAALGLYAVVQFILRIRQRVRNPDSSDPASGLIAMLRIGPSVLLVVLVVANILAVAKWGLVAVIALIALDLLAVLAVGGGALFLWERADARRRSTGYVISELDYAAAPRQVKSAMRRIFRAARSIRGGRAYSEGMFGDIELDQLVYGAAERAVLSSELSTAMTDLKPDATAADKAVLDHANEQIDEIIAYLGTVESSLHAGARAAGGLSARIEEPEKRREAANRAEAVAEASAARRDSALSRVEAVTARASAKARIDPTDVEDRLRAVQAGYEEAAAVSGEARDEPGTAGEQSNLDHSVESAARPMTARDLAWKAAKNTANKTARVSTAAAKSGTDRYKNRRRDK